MSGSGITKDRKVRSMELDTLAWARKLLLTPARADFSKGQNRTLTSFWPTIFADEQDAGPTKG